MADDLAVRAGVHRAAVAGVVIHRLCWMRRARAVEIAEGGKMADMTGRDALIEEVTRNLPKVRMGTLRPEDVARVCIEVIEGHPRELREWLENGFSDLAERVRESPSA